MDRQELAPSSAASAPKARVEVVTAPGVALVVVSGLVDETFRGFGEIDADAVVVDVSRITRMTSFGVRQWVSAMTALPPSVSACYLLGCPIFIVDQLNMVLNFAGPAKVLTVAAPFMCPSCGAESTETVDVLAHRSVLARGGVPELPCPRCASKLEFDETPQSYFAFVSAHGATGIRPAAHQVLVELGRYTAPASAMRPPDDRLQRPKRLTGHSPTRPPIAQHMLRSSSPASRDGERRWTIIANVTLALAVIAIVALVAYFLESSY